MHNSGVVLVHPQDEHDRMQADCQHACACEAQDLRLLLMKRWLVFVQAQPQEQQTRPAVARVLGGSWAQTAAG